MKRFLYFLLFVLWSFMIDSQNLVPNPSFEKSHLDTIKKLNFDNNFIAENWFSPSKGTPDFYSENRRNGFGFVNNEGSQVPSDGNSYVGLWFNLFLEKIKNEELIEPKGEYIEVKLKTPLIKNKTYCFKVDISLSDNSRYAINEIDFALQKEKLFVSKTGRINLQSFIKIKSESYYIDKTSWSTICNKYVAEGGEEYLILGAFCEKYNVLDITTKQLKNVIGRSYYYIDNVRLFEIGDTKDCSCIANGTFYSTTKTAFTLSNIFFEVANAKLVSTSYSQLEELRNYLLVNPNYKIEISGHTDNSGKEENNIKLSTERAKAVADYLIENGIQKVRVNFNGYGSSSPKAPNDSPENKKLNRRVDFKLIPL